MAINEYTGMEEIVLQNQNIADTIAPGFNAKVAAAQTVGEDWLTTAQRVMTALAMTQQQRSLMQINLERAKNGQAPLDITAYTGVGVNVGLSQGTQNLVMYGGLAILAVYLLKSMSK